jgi:DNA-binding protein H-NS
MGKTNMAKINLDNLTVKELVALRASVDKTLVDRRQTEKADLKRKMAEMASAAGMSLADVFSTGRRGGAVRPKYRNPDNGSETWSGRGRQPRWLVAKLKKGAKREDFLIT